MKKTTHHLIAEVTRRRTRVELTIGIDLGDVWSHYCTLNEDGEVIDRGRFRTTPKAIQKWFTDVPPARVAMEAGVHSIWVSEQLQELGHDVIVANVRELRAISHSDRSDRAVRNEPASPHRLGHSYDVYQDLSGSNQISGKPVSGQLDGPAQTSKWR